MVFFNCQLRQILVRAVPSIGDKMISKQIRSEIERILEKMSSIEDAIKLREYALVVESLVMSLGRL